MASETSTQSRIDPSSQRISTVYAQAFLGAADKAGQAQSAVEELESLVRDVLAKYPQFAGLLGSAMINPEDKRGIIDRTLGGKASPLLLNFLKVLAAHQRLDCLREISESARLLYNQSHGRVKVEVQTAAPLDDAAAAKITAALAGKIKGHIDLARVTKPELLGGIVLRVGDTLFDGSVSRQLEQLRLQMIHRSVHEIQSRRDRFGYPAGN